MTPLAGCVAWWWLYLGQDLGERGTVHLYRVGLDELTPDDAISTQLDRRVVRVARLIPRQSRRDVVTHDDERVLEIARLARHRRHYTHTRARDGATLYDLYSASCVTIY